MLNIRKLTRVHGELIRRIRPNDTTYGGVSEAHFISFGESAKRCL